MKFSTSTLGAMLAAAVLVAPSAAVAGPVIGLSTAGDGINFDVKADLWTNVTDSGLASKFIANKIVTNTNNGYETEFRAQTMIGTMSNSNNSTNVTPIGLNRDYEITKVVRFQQWVDLQTATTTHFSKMDQSAAMDVDSAHAGIQNVAMYFDRFNGDTASRAIQNGIHCYGTGNTSDASCGDSPDPALPKRDGDGTLILSGHLSFNDASFTTTTPGLGTGAFSTNFILDYVNPLFLDVASGSILGDNFTGTINLPPFYHPTVAWDGTPPDAGLPFLKIDSSQSFAAAVPEPGSLALIGLGLACLGLGERRKAKAQA